MKDTKRMWVWVGVVVVVIAILMAFFWRPGQEGTMQQPVTGSAPAYAPQGQLVANFPKELILDNAAVISDSYAINYSTSTNQSTAVWNSSSSMDSLYQSYKQYLPAHGWTITNDITKYATSRGLYATKGTTEVVSVSIVTQHKESQVTVTYVAP